MKAMTDAERAKEYRKRKKLRAAGLLVDPQPPAKLEIPRTMTLSAYVKSQGEDFVEAFEWMKEQLNLPVDQFFTGEHEENEIEWTNNIIKDLEVALSTITMAMSEYWKVQIDREIERIKAVDLSDPEKKAEALDKIVRLSVMRKSLGKRYRLTLANYWPEER